MNGRFSGPDILQEIERQVCMVREHVDCTVKIEELCRP
jgi:hypothetical protein